MKRINSISKCFRNFFLIREWHLPFELKLSSNAHRSCFTQSLALIMLSCEWLESWNYVGVQQNKSGNQSDA